MVSKQRPTRETTWLSIKVLFISRREPRPRTCQRRALRLEGIEGTVGLMTVLDSFSSHIPESEEEYIVKEEGRHSCTELALALLTGSDQISTSSTWNSRCRHFRPTLFSLSCLQI